MSKETEIRKMVGKLYNIYYIADVNGYPPTYEGTTNNFEHWLKEYNEDREEDNQFYKEDFELKPVWLFVYLKESEDG